MTREEERAARRDWADEKAEAICRSWHPGLDGAILADRIAKALREERDAVGPKSWRDVLDCKLGGESVDETAAEASRRCYRYFCHNDRIYRVRLGTGYGFGMGYEATGLLAKDVPR